MVDICLTDFSGDGKVSARDYSIIKKEFGRADCPCDISWDYSRCDDYLALYSCCLDLSSAGRNLDYNVCKSYTDETTCESNGCTWKLPYCVIDICLAEVSGDSKVTAPEYAVFKKEFGRGDCP